VVGMAVYTKDEAKERGDAVRDLRIVFDRARGLGDIPGMGAAYRGYMELSGGLLDAGSHMRLVAWGNVILRAQLDAGLDLDKTVLQNTAAVGAFMLATSTSPGKPKGLPDSALVCRGGLCTADRFAAGSGVNLDATGRMSGASVNSAADKTLKELSATIPNLKLGVTTVGDVRRAGGDVVPKPTPNNPYHCEMCGVTPQQAEKLFTPVRPNPNR
jgi:hypothetical protein